MTLPVLDEGSETGDPENEPAHIRRTGYFLSGRYPGGHYVAEKPRLSKKPRFACRNCLHITLLITF